MCSCGPVTGISHNLFCMYDYNYLQAACAISVYSHVVFCQLVYCCIIACICRGGCRLRWLICTAKKRSLPLGQTPFLCDIGYLLEVFSAEVLDVGHTLQCHYRGLHCHVLHRCLNTNLFGLGSLRITLLNVVDHEYHGTRISLYRG